MTLPAVLAEPHHDGSELYVPEPPGELGDEVTVRLRVPRLAGVSAVAVRYLRDAEPRVAVAELDAESEHEIWWRASVPVWNPATSYRWLLSGGGVGYAWLNGAGLSEADVTDADDFVLSLDRGGPEWHLGSVVYQVFPDRFARSGAQPEPPEWAVPRDWDELPTGRGPETPREWFGGDLAGIEARLDHVVSLGANALYLTPVFAARSTHRYDATSFEHVDPLLGGDEALAALARAAHARGIRVVGDLTLNHVGMGHEWFTAGQNGGAGPERDFFWFDGSLPGGYESWLGIATLPKLDHRSEELRARLYGPNGVAGRWLADPDGLDGWRIDVANMTGRYRELDLGSQVAHEMRGAVAAARPDALLMAEHAHDARGDLLGGGWHGVMAYSGFTRPTWCWLRADKLSETLRREGFLGLPVEIPRLTGAEIVRTMRAFRAGVPWRSTLHSWVLVDSHDTARFRTVAGSRERQLVGVGLQMTTPGVPMIFAGDELALEGAWGEDARRTMPWAEEADWDRELLDGFRHLIALRRSSDALARGGIRYAHVGIDAIAYLRETSAERLLCLAARAPHEPVRLPLAALGAEALETLTGEDAEIEEGAAVLPAAAPAFHVWRLR